jgi:hypothetical protein
LTATVLATGTLFALLTIVPVVPWQARCYEEPVPGPYRPIFVETVATSFAKQNVFFWRIGNTLFVRVFSLFDGYGNVTRGTIFLNLNKIIAMLANDITIEGVTFPKPPALKQIEEDQRARGTYDGLELCRAAIRPSPTDPPVP